MQEHELGAVQLPDGTYAKADKLPRLPTGYSITMQDGRIQNVYGMGSKVSYCGLGVLGGAPGKGKRPAELTGFRVNGIIKKTLEEAVRNTDPRRSNRFTATENKNKHPRYNVFLKKISLPAGQYAGLVSVKRFLLDNMQCKDWNELEDSYPELAEIPSEICSSLHKSLRKELTRLAGQRSARNDALAERIRNYGVFLSNLEQTSYTNCGISISNYLLGLTGLNSSDELKKNYPELHEFKRTLQKEFGVLGGNETPTPVQTLPTRPATDFLPRSQSARPDAGPAGRAGPFAAPRQAPVRPELETLQEEFESLTLEAGEQVTENPPSATEQQILNSLQSKWLSARKEMSRQISDTNDLAEMTNIRAQRFTYDRYFGQLQDGSVVYDGTKSLRRFLVEDLLKCGDWATVGRRYSEIATIYSEIRNEFYLPHDETEDYQASSEYGYHPYSQPGPSRSRPVNPVREVWKLATQKPATHRSFSTVPWRVQNANVIHQGIANQISLQQGYHEMLSTKHPDPNARENHYLLGVAYDEMLGQTSKYVYDGRKPIHEYLMKISLCKTWEKFEELFPDLADLPSKFEN